MKLCRSRRSVGRCCAFALLPSILALVPRSLGLGGNPGSTVDKVRQAWSSRQQRTTNLSVIASGVHYVSPKYSELESGPDSRVRVEEKEIELPYQVSVIFGPVGKLRFEERGKKRKSDQPAVVDFHSLQVWNGPVCKLYFPEGDDVKGFHIQKRDEKDRVPDARILPLVIPYRPFDPNLGDFTPEGLELLAEGALVHQLECVVVRQGICTVWAAPSLGYLPLRYSRSRDKSGEVIRTVDIKYVANEPYGWVPAEWKNTWFQNGAILDSYRMNVTKFEVLPNMLEENFDLPVPKLAYVHDSIRKETYLIRENGDKRPILRGEYNGRNFDDLVATSPGGSGLRVWVVALAILNVGAFLLFRILRNRSRRAGNTTTTPEG